MKVTVCFGSVRVVVPCGEGNFLVRDLMQRATTRYCKATAKTTGNWVTVANLRQLDGGILDPDDRLGDVVDDRDQLIAVYHEHPATQQQEQQQQHRVVGGVSTTTTNNGTTGIRHGTDIINNNNNNNNNRGHNNTVSSPLSSSAQSRSNTPDVFQAPSVTQPFRHTDIEVTGELLNTTPPPLHVRRGSEPTLNRLSPITTVADSVPPQGGTNKQPAFFAPSHTVVGTVRGHHNKRWSAAPVVEPGDPGHADPPSSTPMKDHEIMSAPNTRIFLYPGEERGEGSGEEKNPSSSSATSSASSHHSATNTAFSRFARDNNRCSIQVLSDNPSMSRWADAAERIGGSGMSYNEMRRRDPVGGSSSSPHHSRQASFDARHSQIPTTEVPVHDKTNSNRGHLGYDDFRNVKLQTRQDVNIVLPTTLQPQQLSPLHHQSINDYQNLPPDHPLLQGHTRTKSIDATLSDNVRSHSYDRHYDSRPISHHERSRSHDSYAAERIHYPNDHLYKPGEPQTMYAGGQTIGPNLTVQQLPNDATAQHSNKEDIYGHSISKRSDFNNSTRRPPEPRVLVVLNNGCGPLGIHVIPSPLMGRGGGQEGGLLVEGVEEGGRVAQDGRIQVHDRIIDINDHSLLNTTFHQAQEIFKDAMQAPALRLLVSKAASNVNNNAGSGNLHQQQPLPLQTIPMINTVSGGPPKVTSLSSRTQTVMLQSSSRRPGRHITLCLTKGQHGLGFSITTRDNPARGHAPIYIKSILPKGAAIEDGTLRIGDKLISVNGKEVTGLNQTEVAIMLRKVPVGGRAILEVSRQERGVEANAPYSIKTDTRPTNQDTNRLSEDHPPSPQLPRQIGIEKAWEDSLMFPWKHREIMTLDIPIHDSERAGLGVSVKGKTSSGNNGSNGPVDLGIFVKNVIFGGAASRDGRLRENDQLVNINGMSLLGKPNSEAMNSLRVAMHAEGPVPGMITLTIARRVGNSGSSGNQEDPTAGGNKTSNSLAHSSGRDSAASNSTGTETLGYLGGTRTAPTTPTPGELALHHVGDMNITNHFNVTGVTYDPLTSVHHNPVLHRLTGTTAALRNDSYYQATHQHSWNNSELVAALPPNAQQHHQHQQQQHHRPGGREACVGSEAQDGSGVVVVNTNATTDAGGSVRDGGSGGHDMFGSPTVNQPQRDTLIIQEEYTHGGSELGQNNSCLDETYNSQSSLDAAGAGGAGDAVGFSRDQFGRQSMSEKRHATLDAKSTDTYQRNKKAREEREKQKQELLSKEQSNSGDVTGSDIGPGLGMKKSSSLESLQTMVQEVTLPPSRGGSGRVPRGRGCNESFRAAVDRSYEAPLGAADAPVMDTLAEEDSEGPRPAMDIIKTINNRNINNSSTNNSKKNKGLLKGLGSMFRFGKHRKTLDNNVMPESMDAAILQQQQQQQVDHIEHRHSTYDPAMMDPMNSFPTDDDLTLAALGAAESGADSSTQGADCAELPGGLHSRTERMQQLRAQHQRRHAQRNRTYPSDMAELHQEQRLEPLPPPSDGGDGPANPPEEYGLPPHRPGSRGVRGQTLPTAASNSLQFAHYANYQQIQQQIRSEEQERLQQLASRQYRDFREKHHNSRECREYQSQRGSRDSQARPVSNYYEYESVQQALHSHHTPTTPLHGHAPHSHNTPAAALHTHTPHRHNTPTVTPHSHSHTTTRAAPMLLHSHISAGKDHEHQQLQQQQHPHQHQHMAGLHMQHHTKQQHNNNNNNNNVTNRSRDSNNSSSKYSSNSSHNNNNNNNSCSSSSSRNNNTSSNISNNSSILFPSYNISNGSATISYASSGAQQHNSLPRRPPLHQHFTDNLPIVTGNHRQQQQQQQYYHTTKHASNNKSPQQQQQQPYTRSHHKHPPPPPPTATNSSSHFQSNSAPNGSTNTAAAAASSVGYHNPSTGTTSNSSSSTSSSSNSHSSHTKKSGAMYPNPPTHHSHAPTHHSHRQHQQQPYGLAPVPGSKV